MSAYSIRTSPKLIYYRQLYGRRLSYHPGSIKEVYLLKHHKCLGSGFIFKVSCTVTLKKRVLVGMN